MIRFTLLLTAILAWLPSLASAGSTLRCGSALISTGNSYHEVIYKCGQPVERTPMGYKAVLNEYGHVNDVQVEEWVYGPRNGMYHFLRFEGGSLEKISSSRR